MRLQLQPVFDLFTLHFILDTVKITTNHIWDLLALLVQAALDSPLDACSIYVQHYEPYLKDPVGFPRVMVTAAFLSSSLVVSARSILLLLADPSSNNQATAGTQRAASLTARLYSLSVQLIKKPFFIMAAMSRDPTHLLSLPQLDIRRQWEQKWFDLHSFLVPDLTWLLLLLDYLFWVRAVCALLSAHSFCQ